MPDGHATTQHTRKFPGFCALCRARCGCISVVENGRLVAVEPNPDHPTGAALCAKGRAAPDLVYSSDRLLHPDAAHAAERRRRPGWQRIGWDEALDIAARNLNRIRASGGPESVAFSVTTPSATALSDAIPWIERLINAFNSPNWCYGTELCNWHKDHARKFTFGVGVTAPDFERTGCLLLWGHNPSTSWLTQAEGALAAKARGARIVVVDPRPAGLANKADLWLRVRPGSDGALALAVAGVMIEQGWYDVDFMRDWSNGPLLVDPLTGRLLTAADINADGSDRHFVALDELTAGPILYDPASGTYTGDTRARHFWAASRWIPRADASTARPASNSTASYATATRPNAQPASAGSIPTTSAAMVHACCGKIGPVAYYGWTGVGQHSSTPHEPIAPVP